ncbi:MAG: nucleotide exchange factor GrpE [Halobacteriovoraceae bacterium]|nr:nucleotide exchange factor GrpE [Halobacteriovoraceae bacterium]|tara:strand:- start:42034 stop:42591 length:558 start_codon:yes stop_codon:yes gene_type:complete
MENEVKEGEAEAKVSQEKEPSEESKAEAVSETEDKGHDEIKDSENYKDKYYYVVAEMQNMQKRFDREKQNLLKYGNEKVLKDVLDVVDNFERTLGFISDTDDKKVKNIVVGIEMIQKQLLEALEKHGLKKVDAMGESFDPNYHEALGQEESEGKKDEEVIKVHQNGYMLNDRLIRPAKVVIAKNN